MVDCRYRTVLLPSSLALGDWWWFGVTFHLDKACGDVGMGLRFLAVLAIAWGNRALLACPMVSSAAS